MMNLGTPSNLFILNNLAERVGFSQALCYSLRAFNKIPETIVLTDSYLVSHQEHASHKKH
jgi:hypothetical protein